jgi:hypothetical protein
MPEAAAADSTAVRPTSVISRSAAVLSLLEIMSSAACSTVTWVPAGSVDSSPEGRLVSWLVRVSRWSQLTVPAAMARASASST